jgi:hypothetical protein
VDNLARGSGRGAARSESLGQWAWFLGTEVVSDWAGRDVDCSLVRRGFAGKSLRNLEHQNFGFATEGRYLVSINPSLGNDKPEQMEPMFRKIDDRLRQIPGVRA